MDSSVVFVCILIGTSSSIRSTVLMACSHPTYISIDSLFRGLVSEASRFEVKSDALIWSASFEAVLEPPLDSLIAAFARKAVDRLAADGLVP